MPPTRAEAQTALARAKAVLDQLELYPTPVRIAAVRVVVAPWLFRLPVMRRWDGYAAWNLILLRHPIAWDPELLTHELCHVWQMQHHPLRMPLSYLRFGYAANHYEREAREAAARTPGGPTA